MDRTPVLKKQSLNKAHGAVRAVSSGSMGTSSNFKKRKRRVQSNNFRLNVENYSLSLDYQEFLRDPVSYFIKMEHHSLDGA